jgi:hypothetical protein
MTYRCKHLVIPLAGALVFALAAAAHAQSDRARQRANPNSAVAQGTSNGAAATLKGEFRTPSAVNTGKVARRRGQAVIASSASAAPVALALDDPAPGPASNPEPLTIIAIGGAMAGLYRLRRHLT